MSQAVHHLFLILSAVLLLTADARGHHAPGQGHHAHGQGHHRRHSILKPELRPDLIPTFLPMFQESIDAARAAADKAGSLIVDPKTPKPATQILKQCQEGFKSGADNLQAAKDALAKNDSGTALTNLSKVSDNFSQCGQGFKGHPTAGANPLDGDVEKLTSMGDYCLHFARVVFGLEPFY